MDHQKLRHQVAHVHALLEESLCELVAERQAEQGEMLNYEDTEARLVCRALLWTLNEYEDEVDVSTGLKKFSFDDPEPPTKPTRPALTIVPRQENPQ
jgi:hypothetical protein